VLADMSDAEDKLRWAMDPSNEQAVRTIAQAGFELVRDRLTNTDVKEYWRKLLTSYGALASWEVDTGPIARHASPHPHTLLGSGCVLRKCVATGFLRLMTVCGLGI
jgi:hypothetical protein